jgi:hypothetical protein
MVLHFCRVGRAGKGSRRPKIWRRSWQKWKNSHSIKRLVYNRILQKCAKSRSAAVVNRRRPNPIKDYMRRHDCGFPEALEALAAQLGSPTVQDVRRALQSWAAPAHRWICSRRWKSGATIRCSRRHDRPHRCKSLQSRDRHCDVAPHADLIALGMIGLRPRFLGLVASGIALFRVSTLLGLRNTVDSTSKRECPLACTNARF